MHAIHTSSPFYGPDHEMELPILILIPYYYYYFIIIITTTTNYYY